MFKHRALRLIAFSLALPTLLIACTEKSNDQGPRQPAQFRVVVEPVQLSQERTHVEAVGTSRASRAITIYPADAGEVVALHFSPGQFVEAGQVLLELDQREQKLAVELARVRLADAERLYKRYERSAASGATLPTTLDAAKTALETARIELDRALVELADRSVKAPFAGYVGITEVDTGDRIQTTTPITTLDDRKSLLVSFAVPELLIGKMKVGDQISVATWNATSSNATGEVINLDSRINPATRTFIAEARVDNSGDLLRPGMSFRVALNLEGEPYPVLPEIAVQWGAEGSFVWTAVNGKATRVPVNIVQRQRGQVLVEAKLEAGDLVVVEGIQRMRPGIAVKVDSPQIGGDVPTPAPSSTNEAPGPG